MRSSLIIAAVAGVAVAQPHRHSHRRSHIHHNHALDKRALFEETVTVTETACVLDGKVLTEAECQDGIKNKVFEFADGAPAEFGKTTKSLNEIAQPQVPVASPAVHAEVQPIQPVAAAPAPAPAAPAPVAPLPVAAKPVDAPISSPEVKASVIQQSGRVESFGASAGGVSGSFPSGQLSCNEFPSAYGAVRADWLEIGGWLSVQKPGALVKRGGFTNIMTVVPNMCPGGNCCLEGAYCSYACPTGYFKSQWPTIQGSTGQSVGGLLCENGKLVLTNPQSNKLCVAADRQTTALIKNTMNQAVSICQTNYPGDEAMTIPLVVQPGATVELPIIDGPKYWRTHEGKTVSAQYYLNNAGVPHEKACQWAGTNSGNWAPLNLGAGWNGDMSYIGLIPNWPTNLEHLLDYNVRFEGGSLPCKYENGQICWGQGYTNCKAATDRYAGCTVALNSGDTTTLVLSR